MLFTELMHAIHPHLMRDADVPSFTRNIIQMLCDIPEEDWYTKKDPSSEQRYKDDSLRKFYNRGVTKKLAKSMLGSLNKDNFVESITDPNRNDVVLEGLINDISPFCNKNVDVLNVADELFDLFHKSLEYIVNPELENDRKLKKHNILLKKQRVALVQVLLMIVNILVLCLCAVNIYKQLVSKIKVLLIMKSFFLTIQKD